MKASIFAHKSNGDRLVKVVLGGREFLPSLPGLRAFLDERRRDYEFVEAENFTQNRNKALCFYFVC